MIISSPAESSLNIEISSRADAAEVTPKQASSSTFRYLANFN